MQAVSLLDPCVLGAAATRSSAVSPLVWADIQLPQRTGSGFTQLLHWGHVPQPEGFAQGVVELPVYNLYLPHSPVDEGNTCQPIPRTTSCAGREVGLRVR